jgi:hypothetical protein
VFLHLLGSAGHVPDFGASGAPIVDALFFLLRWDRYGFHKMHAGTCYVELPFLHPVGSVGHIVHSGVSRKRNVDALFFMLGWDQCSFHKKRVRTRYVKLVFLQPLGSAGDVVHSSAFERHMSTHYFLCSSGTGIDSTNSTPRQVMPNLCFYIRRDFWVM